MIYGCVCDSSWAVGLSSGQRQSSEWFQHDCSLRHCPTGDDPRTTKDETDCYNVTAEGGYGTGTRVHVCTNVAPNTGEEQH